VDLAALNRRLLAAAYDGDLKKARLALVAGANVNVESRGWTPLMFAAYFNRLPLAKLLVSRGADPHVQKDGWNAQELAAFKGHTTVAKFIAGELRSERQCDCQQGLPAYKARDLGEPGRP
ncbi:MAG: ankyrin repeat domain-containing protein, partial [Leptospirales bacterium]